MPEFWGASFKIKGYKCFKNEPQGFDYLERLNLIVGRNNTGKSALLDLVEYVADPSKTLRAGGAPAEAQVSFALSDDALKGLGSSTPLDHRLAGVRLTYTLSSQKRQQRPVDIEDIPSSERRAPRLRMPGSEIQSICDRITLTLSSPMAGRRFTGMAAERHVKPEGLGSLTVARDGTGCTSVIAEVVTGNDYDSAIVEVELLEALNQVIEPDSHFDRITVQRIERDGAEKWEVFFDESRKGRIALSASGSGFQTVIIVLVNMMVLPRIEGHPLGEYLFAFEEVENNLHPGLQRRLVKYMYRLAVEQGCVVILTSHSTVLMDYIAGLDSTRVFHVMHDGESARVSPAAEISEVHGVLKDLGVRASDILQANGVVWVEGVTDRMYIQYWMGKFCEENPDFTMPKHGSEFVFVEYGGSCLPHYDYSGMQTEELRDKALQEAIPALRLSRNVFVIADSDRTKPRQRLSSTKLAVRTAVGEDRFWATEGKEIENYLPDGAVEPLVGKRLTKHAAIMKIKPHLNKRDFARRAIAIMESEGVWFRPDLNLKQEIRRLLETIASWNQ